MYIYQEYHRKFLKKEVISQFVAAHAPITAYTNLMANVYEQQQQMRSYEFNGSWIEWRICMVSISSTLFYFILLPHVKSLMPVIKTLTTQFVKNNLIR